MPEQKENSGDGEARRDDTDCDENPEKFNFNELRERATEAIVTMDEWGVIRKANLAACEMFGDNELIGRRVKDLMGEQYEVGIERELTGKRKDGSTFPTDWQLGEVPIGDTVVYTAVIRDITESKRIDAVLLAATNEIEGLRINQALTLRSISRDLGKRILAILLTLEAMKAKNPKDKMLLNEIEESTASLSELLKRWREAANLDMGNIVPHIFRFSPDIIRERLINEFAPQAKKKEVELRIDACSAIIRSDPKLLHQILQNLLSNAVHFTDEGGVEISFKQQGDMLHINVTDTGPGIPKELQETIFKQFYQIGNDERDQTQGLGLGLDKVRKLLKLLDIQMAIDSKDEKGATFEVKVPISTPSDEKDLPIASSIDEVDVIPFSTNSPKEVISGRKLQVLIVDDDRGILMRLKRLLKERGYEVSTAINELSIMFPQDATLPDIVISDELLRGVCRGLDVIKQIRAS